MHIRRKSLKKFCRKFRWKFETVKMWVDIFPWVSIVLQFLIQNKFFFKYLILKKFGLIRCWKRHSILGTRSRWIMWMEDWNYNDYFYLKNIKQTHIYQLYFSPFIELQPRYNLLDRSLEFDLQPPVLSTTFLCL
jgi:hypothetical protein